MTTFEEWRRGRWEVYRLLDKRVRTPRGPGKLWQVIDGEARVILDSDPEQWIGFDPGEIREEG